MFLQKRTRWKWAYPNHYKRAFACSIFPYLYSIVFSSRRAYPLQKGSCTGLPRYDHLTGRVRCCLYTGRSTSMCKYPNPTCILSSCHFGQCVSTTFTLSRMTIRPQQFKCFHHTIQADTFGNVVILQGILSRQLHTPTLPLTHVPVGYS